MGQYTDSQQLDAWMEWKELCAINLCQNSSKKILGELVLRKFNNKCQQITHSNKDFQLSNSYISHWEKEEDDDDDQKTESVSYFYDAFYRLESFAIDTKHQKTAKCYKDWLFYTINVSSSPPLKVINGCVLNIRNQQSWISTIVKEYLKKEVGLKERNGYLINIHQSLDAQYNNSSDDKRSGYDRFIEEDIVSAEDVLAVKEYKQLAEKMAIKSEPDLDQVTRVALAVDLLKLTRSDEKLLHIVGYTSSSGFNYIFEKKFPKLIKKIIIETGIMLGETPITERSFTNHNTAFSELKLLTLYLTQALYKQAFLHIKRERSSETLYDEFLTYYEEQYNIL